MRARRALWVGAVAALAAAALVALIRWLAGARSDPVEVFGALVVPSGWPGWWLGRSSVAWVWLAGAAAHAAGGALLALGYAAGFERVTRRGGALIGLLFAVPHLLLGGIALAWLPALRPLVFAPEPPGAFLAYEGAAAVASLVVFVGAYGALVGRLYGRVTRSAGSAGARD